MFGARTRLSLVTERVNLRFTTQKEIVLRKGNLRLNGLLMALSGRANRADECPSWGQ